MNSRNVNVENLTEYRAYYNECPIEDLKEHTCILPISVGQDTHEGKKFEAALKLINNTFKECIIVVCDSLQRHTLAIDNPEMNAQEVYSLALRNGEAWINRNAYNIDRLLTIHHEVLRWDKWLNSPEYLKYRDGIEGLCRGAADRYRDLLNNTAERFVNKLKQTKEVLNYGKAIKLSVEYLKEESALACLWHKERNCKVFIIYNGINRPIKEASKFFNIIYSYLTYKLKPLDGESIALQNILNISPAHLYWKDSAGVYLGSNQAHLEYFGFKNIYALLGKNDLDLLQKPIAKQVRKKDLAIIRSGKAQVTKETDSNGTVFLSYKAPLRNYNNEIVGIIGNSIDITKQEKAENKLKQRTRDLAFALEAKERFLRNMSHEIRTPLAGMLGIPQSLKDEYDNLTDEERKFYIDGMIRAGDRLMTLVSNLLDLSKFREGRFSMNFKEENLKNVFQDVVNEFSLSHGKLGLKIDREARETIVCDKFRIGQVLRNLIGNSIKHGGREKPITISISNYKDQGKQCIKCTVKDEGVGIPVGEEDTIFDVFVESSKTKSSAGGTGLGLSIAKEIVESHKGKIWVDDLKEGEVGARISFTIGEVR